MSRAVASLTQLISACVKKTTPQNCNHMTLSIVEPATGRLSTIIGGHGLNSMIGVGSIGGQLNSSVFGRMPQRFTKAFTKPASSTSLQFKALTTEVSTSANKAPSTLQKYLGYGVSNAISLQLSSLWQRYGNGAYALAGVLAAYLLWRTTFRLTSFFVDLTETMAEIGILGLASTVVVMIGLYLRSYYTINPATVYRQAMYRLNTNPGVLEILGAPLVGGDVRVSVMSGGGLRVKALKLKRQSPRMQMMFKLHGSERHGLVSVEAKKKKGAYVYKLLALDVQASGNPSSSALEDSTAEPGSARIYLHGDATVYERGGLLWELRKPYLAAINLRNVYDVEDEMDDQIDRLSVPKSKSTRPSENSSEESSAVDKAASRKAAETASLVEEVKAKAPSLWQRFFGPKTAPQ